MSSGRSSTRTPRRTGASRTRRTAPAADRELVKMAVLSRRSGVPAPTIKHYIREGLLPGPAVRTSRNMAYYDARLASRIRVIKDLQATRFLPLRVIGELLEPAPSDRVRPEREAAHRAALTELAPAVAATTEGQATIRRRRAEVIRTLGISAGELERLERAGILELRGEGATAGYSGVDLRLLELIADVRRLGLTDVFPLSLAEPYLEAVERLVAFEIDVFRHRALDRAIDRPLEEVARLAVELGERLIVALRAKRLPAALAGDARRATAAAGARRTSATSRRRA